MDQRAAFTKDITRGTVKQAMKDVGAGSSDLWKVPLGSIRTMEGFNVRIHDDAYKAHIRLLTDSIAANGFYAHCPIPVIVVKEGGNDIIYATGGHSRLEAALLAQSEGAPLDSIPVVPSPKGANIEDLTVALINDNAGRPLSYIEQAAVCKRLVSYGWTETMIATKIGKSLSSVQAMLDLGGGPKAIRDMVHNGEVSGSLAVAMMRKHGEDAVSKLREAREKVASTGKKRVTAKALTQPARELTDAELDSLATRAGFAVNPVGEIVPAAPGHDCRPHLRSFYDLVRVLK